jgi:hypothetical protein
MQIPRGHAITGDNRFTEELKGDKRLAIMYASR